jgi:hypothetical protein
VSVAAEARQIGAGREVFVSEAAFADEVAGRRALWWAGVPGLDPLHPVNDHNLAAQFAAMACAAHCLGAGLYRDNRFRGGASRLTGDFYEWLTRHTGDVDARLRRQALLLASDIPRLPPDEVLDSARALHGGVT